MQIVAPRSPARIVALLTSALLVLLSKAAQSFRNQTLRLIVHISAGGRKARIKISNTHGDQLLFIGGAHIARRAAEADIDPTSDRTLKFHGQSSTTIPA